MGVRAHPKATRERASARILLADEQAVLLDALRMLLDVRGEFRVVGRATDESEAVRLASRLRPAAAILGTDLAGFDGIEATRRIRIASPSTRVLILSAHPTTDHVYAALRAGADGYLLKKSSDGAQVLSALRQVLKGEKYVCRATTQLLVGEVASGRSRREAPMRSLTGREREVLRLTVEGKSGSEAGSLLGISPKSVETYRSRIKKKLHIRDVPGLVKFAIRQGLVALES